MANEEGNYDQDLEDRIIRIITKIKKNRNRPCLQNIFTMLTRGGRVIDTNDLKVFIDDLILRNILVNNGNTESGDSFRIGGILHTNINDFEVDNTISTQTDILLENSVDDAPSVESFINENFYEVISKKIRDEVKVAVCNELSNTSELVNKLKLVNSERVSDEYIKECDCNTHLIQSLNNHIDFLQKEISSKDTIINMLVNDKCVISKDQVHSVQTSNTQSFNSFNSNITSNKINVSENKGKSFTYPKKSAKVNCDGANNDIPVINNFNTLTESKEPTIKQKTKYRSTTIIGDSIIRDIKQHKIRKDLPGNKVFMKSFSGATTKCLTDYIKPSLRYQPDLFIIHGGTNDLRSEKTSKIIAEDITKLALSTKTDENDVIISGIIRRNDDLNSKGQQVNDFLKQFCSDNNIAYLDNSCIENKHLNNSGVHLNYSGTVALANNFIKYIKL